MKNHTHPDEILLQGYLDGEINIDTHNKIAQHLMFCNTCKIQLSELRNLSRVLHELEDVSLDRDLSPLIISSLHHKELLKRRVNWVLVAQLCLTALILIVLTPLLSTYLLQINAVHNINQLIDDSILAIHEMSANWQVVLTTIHASISQYLNLRAFVTHFTWPPSGNWIWIFPGSILWLIINGLLLLQNGYMKKSFVRKSS